MSTIQSTYSQQYTLNRTAGHTSVVKRFFDWCESQETHRFGWLAAILVLHGCVLAPVTVGFVFLGGNQMMFWGMVIGAMAMALISNLAAMPTKITIPVFFLSVLIDLAVMITNVYIFLHS